MQDATIGGITGVIGGAVGKFALQGLMRVGAAPAVARGLSKVVQVGRRIFGSGDTTGESRLQVTVAKWFTRSTAWGSGSTTSSIGDDVLHHRSINWKKASAAALLSLALGTAGVAIGSNKDKMINSINNTPIEFALHQTEGGPFPLPTTRIGDTKVGQYLQKFASKGSSETAVKDPAVAEGTAKPVSLNQLGLKDGMKMKINDALEASEKFLGSGYKDMGNGRFVSADGTRVVRMGDSDILGKHGGGPHMNFETLVPNPSKPGKMKVDQNLHIYLED
jgi:hypothetical protein